MRYATLLFIAMSLVACERQEAADEREPAPRPEPVVVYADRPGDDVLRGVFAQFTEATGIPVTVRIADGAKNMSDVLNNTGAPPADVLLTDSVADIWTAGDKGALRQLAEETGVANLPGRLTDPDRQWIALGVSPLMMVYADASDYDEQAEYADFGNEQFKGRLCLTSSARPANRSLIAHYIDDLGEREAELIVRRWMANLAVPPLHDPDAVLEAMKAGTCDVSIIPAYAVVPELGAAFRAANFTVAHGAGVARHARYPESAAKLVAWLASEPGQAAFAEATNTVSAYEYESAEPPVSLSEIGWLDEEAQMLAERARWR